MTTLHLVEKTESEPRTVWESYPSWAQFSWLFLLSAICALRGAMFFHFGVDGWQMWLVGAGLLIAWAAVLRRWAHYQLTKDQLTVRNSYTGRAIHTISISDISDVTLQQGVVAAYFGIGTLVIHSRATDRLVTLRGVPDPEDVKIRIQASAWRSNRMGENSHPSTA